VSGESVSAGRLRAGGSTYSASASTRGRVGKGQPWCSYMGTGSRARTCFRSRGLSRRPSLCSHRTCRATAEVSSPATRSALRILPLRSPGGWTRPGSSVRRSWRTRWAVRSSPSSPYTYRGASGRWCSSVRRSIRSGAQPVTSSSAACAMQRGNHGRCSGSPYAMTRLSVSARFWRPPGRRSPTGSSGAYR